MTDPNPNAEAVNPGGDGPCEGVVISSADIVEAISEALTEAVPSWDAITNAFQDGVIAAMPAADAIVTALTPWTMLPPGSHLRLRDDDVRGVDVVAVRSSEVERWNRDVSKFDRCEGGEVMTERGDVIPLSEDRRLRVGRGR
jgi:hypothetical protein